MSLSRGRSFHASFIVPVCNADPFLDRTLHDVHEWLARRPESWELLIVDDASTDGTARILDRFMEAHREEAISRINFTARRGKGFAVRAAMGLARGRFTIFTDCDLAYPVANAARILEELEAGADAAIACRVLRESTYLISPSFFSYLYTRHLLGRFFNLICRALVVPHLLDTQAGLKGFRTSILHGILGRLVMDGFSFDVELLRALVDQGARIVEVPVSFRYDSEPSTVRFALDSLLMLRDLLRIRWRSVAGGYQAAATPRNRPRLSIHADDFGLSPGVNRTIQEGLESGVLTGASILVGCPHAPEAIRWAAEHPWFGFGVHLNLTQGRPILPRDQVSSLVDGAGRFRSLGSLLLRHATGRLRRSEVLAEWKAQIAFARERGLPVTHLDGHQHVHLLPGLLSPVTLPLSRAEGIPIRSMDGPVLIWGGWPDVKGILLWLASRAALSGDAVREAAIHGCGTVLMKHPTLGVLQSLLARMKPGRLYELVVHPGSVDPSLRESGDRYLDGRERERELLSSDELRALIRNADLLLVAGASTAWRGAGSGAGLQVLHAGGTFETE